MKIYFFFYTISWLWGNTGFWSSLHLQTICVYVQLSNYHCWKSVHEGVGVTAIMAFSINLVCIKYHGAYMGRIKIQINMPFKLGKLYSTKWHLQVIQTSSTVTCTGMHCVHIKEMNVNTSIPMPWTISFMISLSLFFYNYHGTNQLENITWISD